jgi:hypothetical protein
MTGHDTGKKHESDSERDSEDFNFAERDTGRNHESEQENGMSYSVPEKQIIQPVHTIINKQLFT